jgi:PHD/YefM family antitoxin component YafN of YafNO toxin-antitoxin module
MLVHTRHETEWVTISKDEYESMNKTIEILSDKDLMTQIKKGKQKNVKSRDFEEVAKELGI